MIAILESTQTPPTQLPFKRGKILKLLIQAKLAFEAKDGSKSGVSSKELQEIGRNNKDGYKQSEIDGSSVGHGLVETREAAPPSLTLEKLTKSEKDPKSSSFICCEEETNNRDLPGFKILGKLSARYGGGIFESLRQHSPGELDPSSTFRIFPFKGKYLLSGFMEREM
ncbi:hypothetical protein TURU_023401 [Turdus rufiventris]|nr:hypothetical protein TURU_023401 [Turdus rufiventris]